MATEQELLQQKKELLLKRKALLERQVQEQTADDSLDSSFAPGANPIRKERRRFKQESIDQFRSDFTDKQTRQAVAEGILQDEFNPELELNDFTTRFLAARSNRPGERLETVKRAFPDADVRMITKPDGGQEVVIKRRGEKEFRSVSQGGFSLGDIGGAAGTILSEETFAEVGAAARTRGLSLLARLASVFGASAGGDIAKEEITERRIRGIQEDTLEENIEKGLITGAAAPAGDLAAGGLIRTINAIKGGGSVALSKEARDVTKFAEEEGLERLSLPQVSDQPILTRAQKQSEQIAAPVGRFRESQDVKSKEFLEKLQTEEGAEELTDAEIDNILRAQEDDIASTITNPDVDITEGGQAIQRGLQVFKRANSIKNNRLFTKARTLSEGVSFDIGDVKAAANKIDVGTLGKAEPKSVVSGTGVLDEAGEEITREQIQQGAVDLSGGVSGGLKKVIDDIKNLDKNVELFKIKDSEFDPFEQLKSLRTRLFDLKQPSPGAARLNNEQRLAGELFDKVTKAIENPKGGGPAFLQAFKKANAGAREGFKVLDQGSIVQAALTDEPAKLVNKFARPENIDSLRVLKAALPERKFKKFQESWESQLLSAPENINKRLNEFAKDPKSLRILMSRGKEQQLRTFGRATERLSSSAVRKTLESQADIGSKAWSAIVKGSKEELDSLVKAAGGKNSKQAKKLRAGLIGEVIKRSKVTVSGVERLDPGKAISTIQQLEDTGLLDTVMDKQMINRLKNLKLYQSFVNTASDTGASLAGGEVAGKLSQVVSVGGGVDFVSLATAFVDVLSDGVIGKILTSPRTTRFLIGTGKDPIKLDNLRTASIVLSSVTADLAEQE